MDSFLNIYSTASSTVSTTCKIQHKSFSCAIQCRIGISSTSTVIKNIWGGKGGKENVLDLAVNMRALCLDNKMPKFMECLPDLPETQNYFPFP